jgi:ABC-type uncharacterized transport system substrate-binding protein
VRQYLALFLLLVSTLSQADAGSVYILLSDNSKLYQQAAEAITTELTSNKSETKVIVTRVSSIDKHSINHNDLIVALGQNAVIKTHYAYTNNPQIYSFIDRTQVPVSPIQQSVSVVIDQPIQRLFDMASTIVSGRYRDKIIVAVSEDNTTLIDEINQISNPADIELEIITVDPAEEPAKVIDESLFNAGALLAIRDPWVWSGENAKWMLYQSYKYNVPVIGYSKRFLKAGAIASVYTTLAETADKTAEIILDWEKNSQLTQKGILYPPFEVEFNKNIARALKITIPEIVPEGDDD